MHLFLAVAVITIYLYSIYNNDWKGLCNASYTCNIACMQNINTLSLAVSENKIFHIILIIHVRGLSQKSRYT